MAYTKQIWHDLPQTDTPINATRLNHIEDGIENVEQEIPQVLNTDSNSTTNTYSCNYINDLFNLPNVQNITASSMTMTGGGSSKTLDSGSYVNIEYNDSKTVARIYGLITINNVGGTGTVTFQTDLRPSNNLTINGALIRALTSSSNVVVNNASVSYTISTSGIITMNFVYSQAGTESCRLMLINTLLYVG